MAHFPKNPISEEEYLANLPPSKSQRKRDSDALQDLGAALVELPAERLKKVPLEDNLRDAVKECQKITSHGARRRQMQYIGKLMRNVDPAPIQAVLDSFNGQSKAETARLHRLESLRTRLLEDEQVLQEIVTTWPQADLQYLRQQRRNALREQSQSKPPKAFREIFRVLRDLDEGKIVAESHDWVEAEEDENDE